MKKRKMTRVLAVLFVLLLLVPFVLASCKDDTKPGEVTSSQTNTPSDKVPSGIPSSFNYGGETFTIC